MTKAVLPEPSARAYTPPRLIRPDDEGLVPEGKTIRTIQEVDFYGPS